MEIEERRIRARQAKAAVELLNRLLETADGGQCVAIGQFEASTLLALLTRKSYRISIMSRLDDFADMPTAE
jgi:hypothetical protein